MAEGGEDIRGENQGRLLEGEPVEERVEADAGFIPVNQEEHLGRLREADDRASRKLERYLLITYVLMCILGASGLVNFVFLFIENFKMVGGIGLVVSVFVFFLVFLVWGGLNDRKSKSRGKLVPAGNPLLQHLRPTQTPRVGSCSGQVPAIDAGNPSEAPPAHLPDPAVAGPSGLQSPVQPAPSEHSYRTLRSGKKTSVSESRHSERQSVLQAAVSGESSATRKISEVALSLSQLTARGISKLKKKPPTRKASIHEESISDDSDDSTPD